MLGLSPSGYHDHKLRATQPPRSIIDNALLVLVRAIHAKSRSEYGWPRVWKVLPAPGIRVGKERVRKLMKLHGIKARGKCKYKVTAHCNHKLPSVENLLNREFTPQAPDRVWTSDIAEVPTDDGWLYLLVVIDLFNRQAVGCPMKLHMRRELAHRCAAHDLVPAPARGGRDLPHQLRQPLPQCGLPADADRIRHAQLYESHGQLLGQGSHRKPVGISEGR